MAGIDLEPREYRDVTGAVEADRSIRRFRWFVRGFAVALIMVFLLL
jgi:hypothetical protein